MKSHEHRSFNIEIYKRGEGYISEIYRKGKLIHTVRNSDDKDGLFHDHALAAEAAREWIDHTYPAGGIKHFGEV